MERSRLGTGLRLVPAGLLLVVGAGLGFLGWRAADAERALAERAARTSLIGEAREASGRLAETAAGLAREADAGERAAVVSPDGSFRRPAEAIRPATLALTPGRDPEGDFYLSVAGEAEAAGDAGRAEEAYRQATAEDRDPICRALAWYRLRALRLRENRGPEAEAARLAFLRVCPVVARLSLEALVCRAAAPEPDPDLGRDLRRGLGGGDDAAMLGLLHAAGLDDPGAITARRADLDRIERLRRCLPPEGAEREGVRIRDGWIVAWTTTVDGGLRLAEAPVEGLPPGVRLLAPGDRVDRESWLVEIVDAGDLVPGVRVAARRSLGEISAEGGRRSWLVGLAVAALLLGGGAALWLTLRAARRAAAAGRARTDFLARVGHDLRTPLARLRLFSETLAAGRVDRPEEIREFASVVQEEAERLSGLVGKVLDLTRADRGRASLRRERIDLGRLVAETAEAHRPLLEDAGMSLELEASEDPLVVVGDEDALRGAVANLLENALRHAGTGSVSVRTIRRSDRVEVEVADRGPGLPGDLGERVFERFVRGPEANGTGAGLGLALVREVAAAHGAEARARSRAGGGAVLTISVPEATA